MPRFSLVLLCLLAVSRTVRADSGPHWTEVRSPHFVILTDSNEKQGRKVAGQFERMRSLFQSVLPYASFDATQPITVLALKDRKGFQSIEPAAYLEKGSLELAGLFLRTQERNYILVRLDGNEDHPYSVVYHEYTHFILRKAEWLPLWLNEGLAEFYQNTDIREKDVHLGQPSPGDILYLRENQMIPLPVLFAVDHNSPYYHEEQKGSVFYSESWALSHYLEITDFEHKTKRLSTYAHLLAQGGDPVSSAQQAFGDLNALAKELHGYVDHGDYRMFGVNLAVVAEEASFSARPVPTAEADAVRADVLADNERVPEARTLIEAVLREDPKSPLAHESMGFIDLRAHDAAGARKWFGEAVELGTDSPFAYFYFATTTLQSGDTSKDDAIESSLRKTIKLDPAFAPAYGELGRFFGMRHRNLEEGSELLRHAVGLEPEDVSLRINMANVYMERDLPEAAIRVLTAALTVAKDPGEKGIVEGRLASIQQFQAQKAAYAGAQTSSAATPVSGSSTPVPAPADHGNRTVTLHGGSGPVRVILRSDLVPDLPTVPASAPHRSIRGVVRNVHCIYPSILTLELEQPGGSLTLFAPDMYKLTFSTMGFVTRETIDPCTGIAGMKARIEYAEVHDKAMAGQLVAIELNK